MNPDGFEDTPASKIAVEGSSAELGNERMSLPAEVQWGMLMDHAADLIFLHDVKGNFVEVNRAACESLGYTREELLKMGVNDLVVDGENICDGQKAWEAMEPGKEVMTHVELGRKDGGRFPAEIRAACQRVNGNKMVLAIVRDTTERMEAERQAALAREEMERMGTRLRESELRRLVALEVAGVVIWEWNLATNQHHIDESWDRMLGYEDGEVEKCYDEWLSLIHPNDLPRWVDSMERHLTGGTPMFEAEFRMKTKTEEWCWILSRGRVMERDENGKALKMAGMNTDITKMKSLMLALQWEKERLELATDAGRLGVYMLDLKTHRAEQNELLMQIYGETDINAVDDPDYWASCTHPDDIERVKEIWYQTVAEGREYSSCHRIIRRDNGEVRDTEVLSRYRVDEEGVRTHMIGVVRDVTEERRIMVALQAAKEKAEEAERAKGRFIASISHELRTPMNGILGMADLLLETHLSKTQEEMVSVMKRSGGALLEIINDILDFSKIEAGWMRLNEAPFDLVEVMENVIRLLEIPARSKGNRLVFEREGSADLILVGDAGRIEQVLMNLVGNAVKFTEQGKVTVILQEIRRSEGRVRVRLGVEDTGVGMPESMQRVLFQPFRQADQSETRRFGGSGLGLAISQQIAKAMGSTIEFQSAENAGAKFWLELDLAEAGNLAVTDVKVAGGDAPGKVAADFRPLDLLLVEDNETNQMVALLSLEQMGHRVTVAATGVAALDALWQDRFDAVLMDCQMPEMDGYETTRRLRAGMAGEVNREVPVVALTAAGMPGDKERCLESGMNGFALKPLKRQELSTEFAACGLCLADGGIFRLERLGKSVATDHIVLDWEQLEELRSLGLGTGVDVVAQVVGNFRREMPEDLELAREYETAANMKGVAELVHKLAGTCASLGAVELRGILKQVELDAKEGNRMSLKVGLERTALAWERLRSELAGLDRRWGR